VLSTGFVLLGYPWAIFVLLAHAGIHGPYLSYSRMRVSMGQYSVIRNGHYMKTMNPYINFSGQCQQALTFYEKALNGKVIARQTYGQAPQAISGANPSHIMYAEFQADGIYFMANDGINSSAESESGSGLNNRTSSITLNITFSHQQEQKIVFDALCDNGKITMPLSNTFWGARFGIVEDQFGISWMLNYQLEKK
jgi:PhnB protein